MISDEDVKRLFQNGRAVLAKNWDPTRPLNTQFHRGVGEHTWTEQHPGFCVRHMSVFDRFNVIPKYCFTCYKVLIEPRTVVELFKLMVILERIKLPNDNTRKCMVEGREQVSGTYKGFIYCRGMEEGKELKALMHKLVSEEISDNIPVTLKRGCSEYAISYPEYAQTEPTAMEYRPEWQALEDLADCQEDHTTDRKETASYNQPAYSPEDARIMLAWLRYAATIGDTSYLKISAEALEPFSNITRPAPFQPAEDT